MPKQVPIAPQLNPIRLKTNLKMAISKLQFIQEKKQALTKQQRRSLAELLKNEKESSAKIRVENIIRDDIYIELLEVVELYCELLLARINILLDPGQTECNSSLVEAVQSIIYSSSYTELKELGQIKDILSFKYGADFTKEAIDNGEGNVPEKVVKRCKFDPPSSELVDLYLCEIARFYNVPYSGLKDEIIEEKEVSQDDEKGEKETNQTTEKPETKKTEGSDLDSLKARFAALKGR
ncbi:unnamed protein product [Candida verbasci]|uniref:Ist1p n=1 Tax=Candida verbasci TaxID=1227364 RepID=A0A9W4TY56_9ASCO|nr:unnamed protein product [Candida verbasci]